MGDAWPKLLQVVYREIFEPLAREAAFQAAIPTDADIPHPPRDASESWFYRQGVAPYWDQVRIQLERSFNKNLEKEDTALNNMVDILEAFLREMGVTCYKTLSGDSYILFRSLS